MFLVWIGLHRLATGMVPLIACIKKRTDDNLTCLKTNHFHNIHVETNVGQQQSEFQNTYYLNTHTQYILNHTTRVFHLFFFSYPIGRKEFKLYSGYCVVYFIVFIILPYRLWIKNSRNSHHISVKTLFICPVSLYDVLSSLYDTDSQFYSVILCAYCKLRTFVFYINM